MNSNYRPSGLVLLFVFLLSGAIAASNLRGDQQHFSVEIEVDLTQDQGVLEPIWRFFGADEPNYTTMKDGQKLLGELGELRSGQVYFRAHNLLTSGDGTPALKWGSTNVYTEDDQGRPQYDWRIVDGIFDSLLERDVRPFVEIGFMPKDLSTQPDPYRHEWRPGFRYSQIMTGWRYPPKDYEKWGELVYQWARHCVERYGAEEVEHWYWQTWNEANMLPDGYWGGTKEEFFKLNDFAIEGVRRALPAARVGGPHPAGDGGRFTRDFLEHCLRGTNYATGQQGTPLDFVGFHAKGSPTYHDGHVRMGIANHLRTIDRGFGIVAEFPELKRTPIIIGESDPEGCAACQGPSFGYRNGTMYSSYTAASFARKHLLADKHDVYLQGALTWAFTFEDQPYFAGFRQLASNGIALPVLNVFRMYGRMSGERIATTSTAEVPLDQMLAEGVRNEPDVAALASRDDRHVWIMVWHYHDDDVPGPIADVKLRVAGLPADVNEVRIAHFRIDDEHSNSYAAWQRMGSPLAPNEDQYRQLEKASELALLDEKSTANISNDGEHVHEFSLPRQGVSLIEITW